MEIEDFTLPISHGSLLHDLSSLPRPDGQVESPLHVLERVWSPSPQLVLQSLHVVHCENATKNVSKLLCLSYLFSIVKKTYRFYYPCKGKHLGRLDLCLCMIYFVCSKLDKEYKSLNARCRSLRPKKLYEMELSMFGTSNFGTNFGWNINLSTM